MANANRNRQQSNDGVFAGLMSSLGLDSYWSGNTSNTSSTSRMASSMTQNTGRGASAGSSQIRNSMNMRTSSTSGPPQHHKNQDHKPHQNYKPRQNQAQPNSFQPKPPHPKTNNKIAVAQTQQIVLNINLQQALNQNTNPKKSSTNVHQSGSGWSGQPKTFRPNQNNAEKFTQGPPKKNAPQNKNGGGKVQTQSTQKVFLNLNIKK